ncbi:MAG TPA: PilN domain-containing protein [Candidatus Paceibacterota bacterium]
MVNLLPDEDKKEVEREYKRRLVIVSGSFLFIAIIFAAVLLIPLLFFLKSGEKQIRAMGGSSEEKLIASNAEESVKTVKDLKIKMAVLGLKEDEYKRPGDVFRELVRDVPKGVKVKGISYSIPPADKKKKLYLSLRLDGTALTRGELLTYLEALKKNPEFSSVTVPVQDLLKERSLDFSLSINIPI